MQGERDQHDESHWYKGGVQGHGQSIAISQRSRRRDAQPRRSPSDAQRQPRGHSRPMSPNPTSQHYHQRERHPSQEADCPRQRKCVPTGSAEEES